MEQTRRDLQLKSTKLETKILDQMAASSANISTLNAWPRSSADFGGQAERQMYSRATYAHEDSLLLWMSDSFQESTDLPAVSRCRGYVSPTGLVGYDPLLSRKGVSLGGSMAFAVVAALACLVSLCRVSDVACALYLERTRLRVGSSFDLSKASSLAASSACSILALPRSRCRHSALKPSKFPTFLASLSAIATLLCLPMLQLIKNATHSPSFILLVLFQSLAQASWYVESFSRMEKKPSTSSPSCPVSLSRGRCGGSR